ncbi:MAG: hypothetical protein HXY48_12450 [Ignavibacteriaceae bacterium]|nr:hypothetical protein [Ignavibacteriaceae bacterium]
MKPLLNKSRFSSNLKLVDTKLISMRIFISNLTNPLFVELKIKSLEEKCLD